MITWYCTMTKNDLFTVMDFKYRFTSIITISEMRITRP